MAFLSYFFHFKEKDLKLQDEELAMSTKCCSCAHLQRLTLFSRQLLKMATTVKSGTNVPMGCIYHITFSLSVLSTNT